MGLLSSFNIGITGLQAAGSGMTVIGDNIANAGTTGFKSSRPEFQDVLATSLKGIDGGDQFGAGTKLAHIKPIFTQGNLSRTDNITDLAISGNGFFVVDTPFGRAYTRDGSFQFDKEGYLVSGDGYRVMGMEANEKGEITNKIGQIRLGNASIPATATSTVNMTLNLDSRSKITKFMPEKPDATSDFTSGITIYDNVGTARLVNAYFNKLADNQWEYHIMVDGKDAQGGEVGKQYEMARGKLIFNDKGVLQQEIEEINSFNFNQGAKKNQKIKFDFGKAISEGGDGLDGTTQYGSSSAISRHSQNGSTAATLTSLSFNDKGILTAVYNNGEDRDIGQISIAKFDNNEGLFKIGKNLLKASKNSGQATLGRPGESGRGEVLAKSIELSNVDIATEFVNLMTTQRNFTANAKTIKTADEMLQEVLGLKR